MRAVLVLLVLVGAGEQKLPPLEPPPSDPNPCADDGRIPYKGDCITPEVAEKPLALFHTWEKECAGSTVHSCCPLGESYRDGVLVPANPSYAAKLFIRACEGGDVLGCSLLASLFRQGKGVPRDMTKALQLVLIACEGGHADACTNAGIHFEDGAGTARDVERARGLYEKGCKLGSRAGCVNQQSLLPPEPRSAR